MAKKILVCVKNYNASQFLMNWAHKFSSQLLSIIQTKHKKIYKVKKQSV